MSVAMVRIGSMVASLSLKLEIGYGHAQSYNWLTAVVKPSAR